MSDRPIPISPKHGLNPSLLQCAICGKDTGVAILGRLPSDLKAPRQMIDFEPCKECRQELDEWVARGCLFIVIRDEYDFQDRHTSIWPYFHSYHVLQRAAVDRWNAENPDCHMGDKQLISLTDAIKIGLVKLGEEEHERSTMGTGEDAPEERRDLEARNSGDSTEHHQG